jgi:hypothetical protein
MADKFLTLDPTKKLREATVVSTGAAQGGDIVALDSTGKLDLSVLPTGVGAEVTVIQATENLSAGDFVNIYDDSGNIRCRLSDNSNGRRADGFVKASVTSGNNASIYRVGLNDDLIGLTLGAKYYLGNAGQVINSATIDLDADALYQFLGVAQSATGISFIQEEDIEIE